MPLFSVWSCEIDTSRLESGNGYPIPGGFLIVAVAVIHPFVASVLFPANGKWDAVVNFEDIPVSKVELAVWALPLLKSEKPCFFAFHKRVVFQSLCPVDHVSIIRTRLPLDFCVLLAMRFRVISDVDRLGVALFVFDERSKSWVSINEYAVLVPCPSLAFPVMSCLLPSCELVKGVMIASAECFAAYHPSVIVCPTSNDGIDGADDRFLRSGSSPSHQLLDFQGMAFDGFFTGGDEGFEPKWPSIRVLAWVCFPH